MRQVDFKKYQKPIFPDLQFPLPPLEAAGNRFTTGWLPESLMVANRCRQLKPEIN